MYIDNNLKMSDAQALTATADSTDHINLGSDRDIGKGEAMALVINVVVAADFTTGDETYLFQLESDSTAAMSSSTIVAGGSVLAADLIAGATIAFPIGTINEQFLQGVYTLAGNTPLVTIDAWISPLSSVDQYVTYADNVTIG